MFMALIGWYTLTVDSWLAHLAHVFSQDMTRSKLLNSLSHYCDIK